MDGNRRWAKEHGLPILEGHRRVANEVLEQLVEHAADVGISYLTFWAFSTENWGREGVEVKGIMLLLKQGLKRFGEKMHKKGVRIRTIGDLSRFEKSIQKEIAQLVELTKNNTRITVIFALNYGGRDEILRAIQNLQIKEKTTEDEFSQLLDTKDIPDPDLIIRTGGEQRLSGFLLWQSEYSELSFPSWYMPDFTPERLDKEIESFVQRHRRFGR